MGGMYHWINFAILFAIVFFAVRKILGRKFSEEREALKLEIELSQSKYLQIKEEFDRVKALLSEVDRTVETIKKEAAHALAHEIERSRQENKLALERMAKDSETKVRAETERARQVLAQELFEAATRAAEDSLKGQKSADSWVLSYLQSETPRSRSNYAT